MLSMFSEALRILDRNTAELMVDRMKDEMEALKVQKDELKAQNEELKSSSEEKDAEIARLKKLLEEFFKIIDPIAINRQGPDIGTQYRTGIYYTDIADKQIAEMFIKEKQLNYSKKIAVEVMPLTYFYPAETYHQKIFGKKS